jgi:hypothetical protein
MTTTDNNTAKATETKPEAMIPVTFPGASVIDDCGTATRMPDEVVYLTREQYLNMERWMD